MTSSEHPLDLFLQQRMQEGNISSTTLVFTFFCDVVTQHGGEIWLGSIIHALAPLGISERLTRTSVFRLVQDGWLQSRKQGRRSYYRLTPTGLNYYQRSEARIYASKKPSWDGNWTLLMTALVAEEKRDALHRGLSWLGYGRMAAGVYALPCNADQALKDLLLDLDIKDEVVTMQAQAECDESLKMLVQSRWKLEDLRQRYRDYCSHYRSASESIKKQPGPGPHSLLLLRVLMVHEYRRILLSDPELPVDMLPPDWEASAAQTRTGEIYRWIAEPASHWVNRELLNAEGNMNSPKSTLGKRFSI